MFRVIAYKDLRPLDWLLGKRMPLAPGEGHVCDRCGAEHAIVFTVLDTETNKTYSVGSGCARQQFGFEPDNDKATKDLIKTAKRQASDTLDAERQRRARELAERITAVVTQLHVPTPVEGLRVTGCKTWTIGDSTAWKQEWLSDAEVIKKATNGWLENRILERIPTDIKNVSVRQTAGGKPQFTVSLSGKIRHLVMTKLRLP